MHQLQNHHHHSRRLLNHLSQLTTEQNSRLLHWHYSEFDDHNFQIHGQTLFYLFILFSIILLVTLMLLYARWYFRFRHAHYPHQHQHHHSQSSHHPAPNGPTPGSTRGLDPRAIQAMPIILHQQSSVGREDEMECCICLGAFEEGDKVKVLPKCDHRFHSDCVDRWLSTQSSCPLCRLSFTLQLPPSDSLDV